MIRHLCCGERTDAHQRGLRERDLADPAGQDHNGKQRQREDARPDGHVRPVRREHPRERQKEGHENPAPPATRPAHQISSSCNWTDLPVTNMKMMTTIKIESSRVPGK